MSTVIFLEDRFLSSKEEAKVSLFDRGYLFGDSVFETLRAYGGRVAHLGAHLGKLERAGRVTGIALPLAGEALARRVQEAVDRCAESSAYVRVTVSRGEGGEGIGTRSADRPVLSIIARAFEGYPQSAYARGVDTVTLAHRKVPAACLDPDLKTGNYLPNILGRREIEARGMLEGLVLSVEGEIVSGTVSNVFFVEGDRLLTPHLASGCRAGVTRARLLELASNVGLAPAERALRPEDVARADEAFFANTLMECLPVRSLDGRALGSASEGAWTRRLLAAYRDDVTGA